MKKESLGTLTEKSNGITLIETESEKNQNTTSLDDASSIASVSSTTIEQSKQSSLASGGEKEVKKSEQNFAEPEKKSEQKPSTAQPQPSFFASHPVEQLISPLAPSFTSKVTQNLGYIFFIPLFVVLAVHMHFAWYDTNLWFTEKYPAFLLEEFLKQTESIIPPLMADSVATSPFYLFLLKFVHGFVPVALQSAERLLALSATIGSIVFLCCTFLFWRFVARVEGKILLLAGLILLSSIPFLWTLYFIGIDFYFAGTVLLSLLFFYCACQSNRSLFYVFFAYAFATVAVLYSGFAGLIIPLGTTLLFTIWCSKPLRLFLPDSLLGLFLALLGIVAWHGFLLSGHGLAFAQLLEIGKNLISVPLLLTQKIDVPWLLGAVFLFLLCPWIFVVVCLPWLQVVKPAFWQGVLQTRKPEKEGIAFLFCFIFVGLSAFLVSTISFYQGLFLVFPAVAVLIARALYRFNTASAVVFRYGMCLLLLIFALGMSALVLMCYNLLPLPAFMPEFVLDISPNIFGLLIPIAFIVATVVIYFGLQSHRVEGVIWIITLLFTATTYPFFIQVAPLINAAMDPHSQIARMQPYVQANYAVYGIGADAHLYAPYGGPTVEPQSFETVKDLMHVDATGAIKPFAKEAPFVLITTVKYREAFSALTLLKTQWIDGQEVSAFISATEALVPEQTVDAKQVVAIEQPVVLEQVESNAEQALDKPDQAESDVEQLPIKGKETPVPSSSNSVHIFDIPNSQSTFESSDSLSDKNVKSIGNASVKPDALTLPNLEITHVAPDSVIVPNAKKSDVAPDSLIIPDAKMSGVAPDSLIIPDAKMSDVASGALPIPDATTTETLKNIDTPNLIDVPKETKAPQGIEAAQKTGEATLQQVPSQQIVPQEETRQEKPAIMETSGWLESIKSFFKKLFY